MKSPKSQSRWKRSGWSLALLFLILVSLAVSYVLVPIPPVDHEEMDSISAALSDRDEPFYPILGYAILDFVLGLSTEKDSIVLFNTLIFSPILYFLILQLGRTMSMNTSLSVFSILLLILNPVFISYFLHTVSLAFPLFTILNILAIIFFIFFMRNVGKAKGVIIGLGFILVQFLASYTTLFAFVSLSALFLSGIIIFRPRSKKLFHYLITFMIAALPVIDLLPKFFLYAQSRGSHMLITEPLSQFFITFLPLFVGFIILLSVLIISQHIRSSVMLRPEKKTLFLFVYLLLVLAIFSVFSFFVRYNASRILSFILPVIYLVLMNVIHRNSTPWFRKKAYSLTILIIFIPTLIFNSFMLYDNIMESKGLYSFREDSFLIIDAGTPDVVVFSPFNLFYDYLPYLNLSHMSLLDDKGDLILQRIIDHNMVSPTIEAFETSSYTLHFTPKLYTPQQISPDLSQLAEFYLLQDITYPDYIGEGYKENNCEIIMSYDTETLYFCTESR